MSLVWVIKVENWTNVLFLFICLYNSLELITFHLTKDFTTYTATAASLHDPLSLHSLLCSDLLMHSNMMLLRKYKILVANHCKRLSRSGETSRVLWLASLHFGTTDDWLNVTNWLALRLRQWPVEKIFTLRVQNIDELLKVALYILNQSFKYFNSLCWVQ